MATIQGDAIFLLKGRVRYCENDKISRRWRDLTGGFRTARLLNCRRSLRRTPQNFNWGCRRRGIVAGSKTFAGGDESVPVALGIAARRQVARNLIGLAEEEALRIFPKCLLNGGKAAAALLDDVLEVKRTALKTDGLLETCGAIRRYELVQLDAGALYESAGFGAETRAGGVVDR